MAYFVTGATGFLGRHLVSTLLKRKGPIHVLVRKDSRKKLDAIAARMGWDMKRIVIVEGHGTYARGASFDEAVHLTAMLEESARIAAIAGLRALTPDPSPAGAGEGSLH